MLIWSIKGMPVWGTSVGITIDIWGVHWTQVSHIAVRFFTIWATREASRICQYLAEEPPSWTFWNLCVCVILQVLWKSSEACWLLSCFSAPSRPLDWDCKVCFVLSSPPPLHHGLLCPSSVLLRDLFQTCALHQMVQFSETLLLVLLWSVPRKWVLDICWFIHRNRTLFHVLFSLGYSSTSCPVL